MADTEVRSNILYPAYINKTRTVANGRRIPLQHAVNDPKPKEVLDALVSLKGFQASITNKAYCREPDKDTSGWCIQYKNNPSKNNLKNKRQILVACAKRINEVRSKSGPAANQTAEGKQKKKK